MSSHDTHERSPKRRRLDSGSESPDSLSRGHVEKVTRFVPRSILDQKCPSQVSTPQVSTPRDQDDSDDITAEHQFEFEDDEVEGREESNAPWPDERDDGQDEAPARPTTLHYKLHMTLKGHKRGVAAVKYSPNGKWIASCSADCTIKIWDSQTGNLVHNLEGHLAGISTITWNPDSTVLASGSDDKMIRLWDIVTVFHDADGWR